MPDNMPEPMTHDRCMELLNAVIDHIAVAENTQTQITTLVNIGFTTDELVNHFNFSQSDIDDYLEDNADSDDD